MNTALDEGVCLFNAHKFFEAHEALEAVWLKARGEEKAFLNGLIQIAAAFHHHTRGNPAGFGSLLEKGLRKLEKFGEARNGIDLAGLRAQLEPWRDYLRHGSTARQSALPSLPRINPWGER